MGETLGHAQEIQGIVNSVELLFQRHKISDNNVSVWQLGSDIYDDTEEEVTVEDPIYETLDPFGFTTEGYCLGKPIRPIRYRRIRSRQAIDRIGSPDTGVLNIWHSLPLFTFDHHPGAPKEEDRRSLLYWASIGFELLHTLDQSRAVYKHYEVRTRLDSGVSEIRCQTTSYPMVYDGSDCNFLNGSFLDSHRLNQEGCAKLASQVLRLTDFIERTTL